jgi:hypothetical protein
MEFYKKFSSNVQVCFDYGNGTDANANAGLCMRVGSFAHVCLSTDNISTDENNVEMPSEPLYIG